MTDLPTTLTDGSGIFVWDVATNGSINDGTSDAFDTGFALSGYSNPNADPNEATPELGGRQLRLGTATIGSFDVTRSIYVPDTPGAGWARFMETVTNTSGSSQVYTLTIQTNLGSDSATSILDTSSGDTTFTTADTYLMTDDSVDGNGGAGSDTDPVVIQYFGNGRLLPDSVTAPNPNGFDTYTYNLTIGAGETVRFLSFGSQNLNRADADADLAFFKTADEALFFGMSEAELETVVNFGGPNLGTGGNDTLIGTFDGETIQGLGGNDLIFARDGTDIIYGGSGDDDIDAGNGSDKVVGGTGNDRIDGGAGNDSIYWNYGDGFDTIDGGADGDILYVGGDASVGNQISITANGSRVNVSWLNLGHYQLDIVNAETIEIHGGADADNVFGGVGLTGLASFVLYGEGGVDTLFGTDTVDTIYGGAGNDIIDAAGGDDIIHADGDNDRISGGAGFDTVIVDLVPATPGTISIDPNSSGRITLSTTALGTKQDIDTVERIELKGGAAGDIFVSSSTFGTSGLQELKIEGGGGGDTITTQSTYDTIKGGAGKDTINAGDGDDVIIIGEGDDLDDIDGGGNAFSGDTLDLSGIMAINGGVTIDTDLAPNANMTMSSLTGSVTGIETIIGSQGDDFIRYEQGAFEHLKVEGGEGSDTIEIEEGDNANGGLGDDTIFHKQTADPFFAGGTVDGGGGSDTLDFSLRTKSGISVGVGGSVATDITTGFIVTFVLDIDNIVGTDMDDSLFGDPSAAPGAFLDGRGGDDILFDVSPVGLTLIGGDGNDIYQVFSPFTVVSETGTGNDTVKSAYDFVLAPGMKVETLETDGSVGSRSMARLKSSTARS